jgi:hypothetical protein
MVSTFRLKSSIALLVLGVAMLANPKPSTQSIAHALAVPSLPSSVATFL